MIGTIVAVVIALVIAWIVFSMTKDISKLIANGLLGLLAMLIMNAVGIGVPINLLSIIVVAIGGLPGLGVVVILHFLGIVF